MIQRVLENHRLLAQRLESIEIGLNIEQSLTSHLPEISEHVPETIQRNAGGFAFEEDLKNSWVYQRFDRKGDSGAFSIISSAGRTASWSMLSGLSLSDNISIIAVQALPVYAHDLSNAEVYQFGEFDDSSAVLEDNGSSANVTLKSPRFSHYLRGRLSRVTAGIASSKVPRKELAVMEVSPATTNRIFGVPLSTSILYANAAINLMDGTGKLFVYGYVPIVVGKTGVFLKEKGETKNSTICFKWPAPERYVPWAILRSFICLHCYTFVNSITNKIPGAESENIFARSGSATRIHDLQGIFEDARKNYGKGLNWETSYSHGRIPYDVHDAASCLLRYLKLLPEPVIPFNLYDQFTAALVDELPSDYLTSATLLDDFVTPKVILRFRQLIIVLPPLHRQLLLYLLDLCQVFVHRADKNGMTSERIVAAFQPALLSRLPSEMSPSDHTLAANTMIFLIENQDHFLIGIGGTGVSDSNDEEPA